jgi:hypothetical protein
MSIRARSFLFLAPLCLAALAPAQAQNSGSSLLALNLMQVIEEQGGKTICMEPNPPLEKLMPALQRFMSEHPGRLQLGYDDLQAALSRAYPCATAIVGVSAPFK